MVNLKEISTCKLVEELKKREGVTMFEIQPHEEEYMILSKISDGRVFGEGGIHCSEVRRFGFGPAIILEVID